MLDRKIFFDEVRLIPFAGHLTPSQVEGMNAILDAWADYPDQRFAAYALATAYVETDKTMQPIREKGGEAYLRRMYDIQGGRPAKARELGNTQPGDGVRYAGRGYVQLTGKDNYKRLGKLLGVDLVADPDRALEPAIAARIMVEGMTRGLFTGRRLNQFFTDKSNNWYEARTIINGHDRAEEIATHGRTFFTALQRAAAAAPPAPLL